MIIDQIEKASTAAVLSEWDCQSKRDKKREWGRENEKERKKKIAQKDDERWRKSVMMDANSFQSSLLLLLEMSGLAWMHYYVCTCS